jgi:pyruvate formate lyase activating enzyme
MNLRARPAAAVILALSCAGLAAAAAAFVAFYPPPSTFASVYPAKNVHVRPGRFAVRACNGVQCRLCPNNCFLPEGARGKCKVRINYGGKIKTLVYGQAVAVHVDPIEKKPVYHMYPGSLVYSLASPGCSLACKGCQNWEISQIYPEQAPGTVRVPSALELKFLPDGRAYGELLTEEVSALMPADIVKYAKATRSKSIAYTYSEPAVFYEYMYDTAKLAREKGLKNVMVSAGYINPEPLADLLQYMDVVKIDLKGFNEDFYRRYTGGRLEPVKQALLTIKKKRIFAEVVNLVIPGLNDSEADLDALSAWVMENLGPDTPLFFSRFSPNYLLNDVPPTPAATLDRARATAMKRGLRYVYAGNTPGNPGENTYCPKCGRVLVRRHGFAVLEDRLTPTGGTCPWDGARVPGIWK